MTQFIIFDLAMLNSMTSRWDYLIRRMLTRQALGRFDITSCHITEQRLSLLVPPPCRFRQSNIYTEYPQIGFCTFFVYGVAGVGTLRKNIPISAVLT